MCITEYNEEETMQMFRDEALAEGKAEGRAEGKAEGKAEGENRTALLISRLLSAGRMKDLELAVSDKVFRDGLFTEFGIA